MFDLKLADYPKIWAIVGNIEDNFLIIPQQEWAPGIWAGTEGLEIEVGDKVFKILEVDMINRRLMVSPSPNAFQLGLEIKPRISGGRE